MEAEDDGGERMNKGVTKGVRILASLRKRLQSVCFFISNRFFQQQYCYCLNWHVGMGNRLITLMNQYVWCGKENIHLCWGLDDWITEPFDALFEMTDAPNFRVKSVPITRMSRMILLPYPKDHTATWRFYVPGKQVNGEPVDGWIDCLYQDTPKWALEKYRHYFEQLRPSERVRERIKTCPIPRDVVCVQIRNSHRAGDFANVSTIQKIISEMKKYGDEQRFFCYIH